MSGAKSSIEIDKDVVDRLIRHIEENSTDMVEENLHVPAAHFLSRERLAAELALLRRLPLIAGFGSELHEPGSFITRDILGIGLILVRRSDGGIACFRNMCRHRGGRLENEPSGKKALFTCQYHGWSYERESGALAGIPQSKVFGDIDRGCHGLESFRAEERQGLIFVWLTDGENESLGDFLGDTLEAQLARWAFQRSVVHIDRTFDLE
ncbi:MAG TPA: Rieske (2Fe-2S) protein, partial [Sphingomonadales bacterium]